MSYNLAIINFNHRNNGLCLDEKKRKKLERETLTLEKTLKENQRILLISY